jgi:hypothetical protein
MAQMQTMEEAQAARNAERRAELAPKAEAWSKFQTDTREAHDLWIAGYTGEKETRDENRARWRVYQEATGDAWSEYLEAIGAYGTPPKTKPRR